MPARESSVVSPVDINGDAQNNVYFLDSSNRLIQRITSQGILENAVGQPSTDISVTSAFVSAPTYIWGNSVGDVYFSISLSSCP